jgi:DNA-binding XRE family transcriptional regulator
MDNVDANHLAGTIRSRRKSLGLTQSGLAEKIGRTTESISNIERGTSLPTLDICLRLVAALNTRVRDLFPDEGAATTGTARASREAQAIGIIRSLPDDALDAAFTQLAAMRKLVDKRIAKVR